MMITTTITSTNFIRVTLELELKEGRSLTTLQLYTRKLTILVHFMQKGRLTHTSLKDYSTTHNMPILNIITHKLNTPNKLIIKLLLAMGKFTTTIPNCISFILLININIITIHCLNI